MSECWCALDDQPDIWRCEHHRYWKDGRRFTSVSRVIKTVRPPDYGRVDQITLKLAGMRGRFVDEYFCNWIMNPDGVLPLREVRELITPEFSKLSNDARKYADQVIVMIAQLCDWWEGYNEMPLSTHEIVYSEADGMAGELDIKCPGLILDLKCVEKLQDNYALELGCFSEYSAREEVSIVRVHPNRKKVRVFPYNAANCRREWREAVEEYNKLACD